MRRDVNEMWWFVRGQLESLAGKKGVSGTALEEQLKDVVKETGLYHKGIHSHKTSINLLALYTRKFVPSYARLRVKYLRARVNCKQISLLHASLEAFAT